MTGSTCLGYQLVVTHCHKNHHFSTEESSFFLIEESSFFLIEESPFVYKTDRTKFLNLGDVCNNANSNMFSNDGFLLKNDDFQTGVPAVVFAASASLYLGRRWSGRTTELMKFDAAVE